MKHSESIVNIAKALAEFNKQVTRIKKDANNPFFKSQYTTLDNMLDVVRPILAEQGISVMQFPGGDGTNVSVKTVLIHASGEYIESDVVSMKPVKNDPQAVGSAITYAKRYSIGAVLGLSTGEVDDDGNAATHNEAPKQNNVKQMNSSKVSEKQVKWIQVNAKKIGDLKNITKEQVLEKFGVQGSVADLNNADGRSLIDRMNATLAKLEAEAQ